MGSATLTDLDLVSTIFDTTHQALLVTAKADRVTPTAAVVSARPTAAWGNLVDNVLRRLQRRAAFAGVSVMETGAVGDGVTDDATKIQDAIDQVDADGGGTVRLPWTGSNYAHGALTLRANVRLHYTRVGTPNGVVTGANGDRVTRLDGTDVEYIKTGGTSTTGWVAITGLGESLSETLAVGQTVTEGLGIEWQDNQVTPVTRAHADFTGDTWRQRFYDSAGVLKSTLSVETLTGALVFTGTILSYGNSATPAAVTHTTYVGATGAASWLVDDGTNAAEGGITYDTISNTLTLRAANADQLWVGSNIIRPPSDNTRDLGETTRRFQDFFAYTATLTTSLTMDSASPTVTAGSGAGSPVQRFVKADAGTAFIYFSNIDATPSAGDFQIAYASDESWRVNYHDATAFRSILTALNDADVRLLSEPQSLATLYIGAASQGVWVYEGLSGGNVTHVFGKSTGGETQLLFRSVYNAETLGDYAIHYGSDEIFRIRKYNGSAWKAAVQVNNENDLLFGSDATATLTTTWGNNTASVFHTMLKSATGENLIKLLAVDSTPSAGDWQFGQNNLEAFILQYHDGAAFRTNIYTYDDRNMLLLGDAQGDGIVTIGSAASTAYNGAVVLAAGATGIPYLAFADTGNAILYDHTAEDMEFHTQGTQRMIVDNRGVNVTLDVAARGLLATGDAGGTSGATTFTDVTTSDIAGAALVFTNNTGNTLSHVGFLKLYDGTNVRYISLLEAGA